MKIDLNCDCGESFGAWEMGVDAALLPHVTSANIACGAHAGDPLRFAFATHEEALAARRAQRAWLDTGPADDEEQVLVALAGAQGP